MDILSELVFRLAKLAIDKRLMDELKSVAPEIPKEFIDEFYQNVFRPVMINCIKIVSKSIR